MRRIVVALLTVCLALVAVGAASAQRGVEIMKTEYKGWPNCYRMTNGEIELIATSDVGPRIIRLGFVDGDNLFAEYPDMLGKTGGDEWRIYGGHRLWHAPEAKPRTYWPDNTPIQVREGKNRLTLTQPTEPTTGIQKTIELTMRPDRNQVIVVHRLRNDNLWAVELAPWALSVMAKTGICIIPMAPFESHENRLLPVRPLAQWAYTDMSDPRWRWGTKYTCLRQDPTIAKPQKLGVGNQENWVAYQLKDNLFVKTFKYQEGATYPDFGCSFETFTNGDMIEVETVGPVIDLAPGATVEHVENWSLFKGLPAPTDDAVIDAGVLPKAKDALAAWAVK